MDLGLKGKKAIVTGATRGIGRAIAVELAARGFRVIGTATSEAGAQAITEALAGHSGCKGAVLDVTDAAGVTALVDGIVKEYGGLHILVNNAGITRDQLVMRMKRADWDAVLNTNLTSAYLCIQQVIGSMLKQRWGRIINITSIFGQMGQAGQANYAASKAGLIGLTMAMAREVASRNITCNAVAPGFVETGMTAVLSEEFKQTAVKMIPLGRVGKTEDVASAVSFLASDEASYITGHVLNVNGGMLMG